jgi:hypothetical protein
MAGYLLKMQRGPGIAIALTSGMVSYDSVFFWVMHRSTLV